MISPRHLTVEWSTPPAQGPSCPTNWLRDNYRQTTGETNYPDRLDLTAEKMALEISQCHQELSQLETLAPGPVTDRCFSRLVELSFGIYPPGVRELALASLEPGLGQELIDLCQLGESEMEKSYSRKAAEWFRQDPEGAVSEVRRRALEVVGEEAEPRRLAIELLRQIYSPPGHKPFPYLDNYVDMVMQAEAPIASKLLSGKAPNLTFTGSGAMDLTADLMLIELGSTHPNLTVTEVDLDGEALELAQALTAFKEAAGAVPPGRKRFVEGDAAAFRYTNQVQREGEIQTDLLFLAAALPTDVRNSILAQLSRDGQPVQGLMVRDSPGLTGQLLYPPTDLEALEQAGYQPVHQAHPIHQLLNGEVILWPGEGSLAPVSHEIVNSTIGASATKILPDEG